MNTAYEAVRAHNDQPPEFEFFRHCRNAAAHSNRFFFSEREPARPAAWRTVTLNKSKKGSANPLFNRRCIHGLIGLGDLIELLSDIERRVP